MNILIAEDEKDIRDLISLHMKKENHNVFEASDGKEALDIFECEKIDLILVDIMMPKINGITVIQKVRESSTVPIMCITAMGSDSDKVLALGIGADDYLVKPISPIELCARVSSHLRRCYRYTENREDAYATGDLKIYSDTFEVYKGDKKIELNPKEFKILKLLISKRSSVDTTLSAVIVSTNFSCFTALFTIKSPFHITCYGIFDLLSHPSFIIYSFYIKYCNKYIVNNYF